MKTRQALFSVLTAVLSVFSVQISEAQAVQDALYIFRNDGGFEAFFYSDIDHIEYSKIDTLGVEQPDYVVQEIYALDSLWRIPISAIDSVAFVTPETKIKSDVFCPDKSIADYIVASDSIYWILLAKNTPSSLIPKKGDKLLIEQPSKFIPDGFGGLVTAVSEGSEGFKVMTEALQLTDVYERLVMKGSAVSSDQASAGTRGVTDGTEGHYDTVFDFGNIDQTLTISGSQAIIEGAGGNASLSIDGTGTIKYRLTPKATVRGFLYVDAGLGVKTSSFVKMTCGFSTDADVSGALTAHVDIPFKLATNKTSLVKFFGKKGDDDKYPCLFDFSAGAFIEATGGITAKMKWGGDMVMAGDITYMQAPGQSLQEPNLWTYLSATASDPSFSFNLSSFALTLGLYAKGELKFNNSVLKEDKFQLGVRGQLGATTAANIGIDFMKISDDLWKTGEDRVYEAVNSDEMVLLDIFADFQAYAKLMKTSFGPWKRSNSLFDFSCAAVPKFHNFEYKIDEKAPSIVKFTTLIGREALFPTRVGYSVFNVSDKDEVSSWWYEKTYQQEEFNIYSHEFDDLDPGIEYVAYPKIHFSDYSMLVSDLQPLYFNLGDPMIEVDKEVEVMAEMGDKAIPLLTNIGNLEFKPNADWLDCEWNRKEGKLTLSYYMLPEEMAERKAKIHVTGKTIDGKTILKEADIEVTQCKAFLFIDPPTMEFDRKGGTKTATITKTNLKDIKITGTTDKSIEASLKNNIITVTMPENTEAEDRGGSVYLEGVTPGGQSYKTYLSVTQKGTGESPVGSTFALRSLRISTGINLKCTNINEYENPPFEGWEPEKNAYMGFVYDPSDANQSVTFTVVDANTLHLECKQTSRETDPDYPTYLYTNESAFSVDITKFRDDDNVMHIKLGNVVHTRDRIETLDDQKIVIHCDYKLATDYHGSFCTMAYGDIYDYDHVLQYPARLAWWGFKDYWNTDFTMNFYEDYKIDSGNYKYVYVNEPIESDGISMDMDFEPNSAWNAWLEGETVDDVYIEY